VAKAWAERIAKRDRDKRAAAFFRWYITAHMIGRVG